MLDDRKLEVLRAIVRDFVSTNEPVGSKALAERYQLGVSPATVRNDMAALEDEGYITQPHTSAGRIPTDRGYRLFVDKLSTVKPLSPAERRAIQNFLEGAVDLDDVVRRTVRLLAQLTRQVAVVQYPSLSRSGVRHVELVQISPTRLLLVLITDTGRVEQRVVELAVVLAEDAVTDLRNTFNSRLMGRRLIDAPATIADLPESTPPHLRPVVTTIISVVLETLVDKPEERVVLAGTANLTRSALDFPHTIRPVLEALEEQVVLLKLLGRRTTRPRCWCESARRTGTRACARPRSSRSGTARATPRWPAWACSARPGWTTRGPWRPCAPSPATSANCSPAPDGD